MKHQQNLSLASERAQRIKSLRQELRFSRQKFADKYEKYGITASALQSWEDIRWNGLTEKGAHILAQAFQEEGLHVTIEWLLFGIGQHPLENALPININLAHLSEKNFIAQELRLFHQHHTETVDAIVEDDGLAPWLMPGDYIAGKRYFDHDIAKACGHACIAQTLAGEKLIRILGSGKKIDRYTLTCSNPHTKVTQPLIEEIELFSAAPILWIRKPELVIK